MKEDEDKCQRAHIHWRCASQLRSKWENAEKEIDGGHETIVIHPDKLDDEAYKDKGHAKDMSCDDYIPFMDVEKRRDGEETYGGRKARMSGDDEQKAQTYLVVKHFA